MFGKLAALFYAITIISAIIVIFSVVGNTAQLQSVDETCGPLSLQHPYQGGIYVNNSTSGISTYYHQGNFCTYSLNYHYDWGYTYLAPVISLIIAVVFTIIYIGWEEKREEEDDDFDETTREFNNT